MLLFVCLFVCFLWVFLVLGVFLVGGGGGVRRRGGIFQTQKNTEYLLISIRFEVD